MTGMLLEEFRARVAASCAQAGRHTPPLPRVTLMRSDETSAPARVLYQPVVCFIAQGAKQLTLEDRVYDYDAGNYLACSVTLPVIGSISQASREKPYLAISIALDPAILASVLLDMAEAPPEDTRFAAGMMVSPIDPDLLDPVVRLLRLIDRPRDRDMLAPLVERELLYLLLRGPRGALLRQIALGDSRLA